MRILGTWEEFMWRWSGGHDVRAGDVDDDTVNWEGFGRIPPQGGP